MKNFLKLILAMALLACPSLGHGQSVSFYTGQAFGVNPFSPGVGAVPGPVFLSYAQVRVCTLPLTVSSPCSPVASVTDYNGNTISIVGGNFGQTTTDVVGRFTFGCNAGNYWVQVAPTGSNTPQLNYPVSCPSGFMSSPTYTNLTVTGTGTFGTGVFTNLTATNLTVTATSTVPTPSTSDSSTTIADTAYVKAQNVVNFCGLASCFQGATSGAPYHIVNFGSALSGGSKLLTLSGAAAFSSTTNYACFSTDTTTPSNTSSVQNISATQITLVGTGSDFIAGFCIGL